MALGVKNPPANAGDIRAAGSVLGSGRSPGGGHGNPLQHSCLKNPVDRGAWWTTDHRVANSLTILKQLSTHAYTGPKETLFFFIRYKSYMLTIRSLKNMTMVIFKKSPPKYKDG